MSAPPDNTALAPTLEKQRKLAEKLNAAADASAATEAVLRYAALSSLFTPQVALKAVGLAERPAEGGDPSAIMVRVGVMARLADACDTRLWHPQWIMRAAPRARVLAGMRANIHTHVNWRRSFLGSDTEEADRYCEQVCAAVLREGEFSPQAIAAALGKAEAGTDASNIDTDQLRRLLRGLTLAGDPDPSSDRAGEVRAALLAVQKDDEPERRLVANFVGRRKELAALRRSLERQWQDRGGGPLNIAYVSGMGGTGKSTLLARVRETACGAGTICVSLDFDRPGVEGGDPLGLSREIARQIAEKRGQEAAPLYHAISAASSDVGANSEQAGRLTLDLVRAIASVLAAPPAHRLLLTLDTLETLTVRGDTAAAQTIAWLKLLRDTTGAVAILAAGREDLPAAFAGEIAPLPLGGLPLSEARAFLEKRSIGGPGAKQVLALANGNPLLLELGVRALAVSKNAQKLTLPANARPEIRLALLYRLILSRIGNPTVRTIAHPGLLLSRIDAAAIEEVIAPVTGLTLSREEAIAALRELAAQSWLVEQQDGWLRHRPALRPILLDLQVEDDPKRARKLFKAARCWHEKRGEPGLALYYQLQGLRFSKKSVPPGALSQEAIAKLDPTLDADLPAEARDLVAIARGNRSQRLRASARPAPASDDPVGATASFDAVAGEELMMLVSRRNFAEAAAMLSRASDLAAIDTKSPLGAAAIETLWRCGDWANARVLLARRQGELGQTEFANTPHEVLGAALADMAPVQFRRLLKLSPSWAATLAVAAVRSNEDSAWHMADLLLNAEGFATSPNGFGAAVHALWIGPEPATEQLEVLRSHAISARGTSAISDKLTDVRISDVVELLLPDGHHANLIRTRVLALPPQEAWPVVDRAAATISVFGQTSGDEALPRVAAYVIDEIDRRGLLAPLATTLSMALNDRAFDEIAVAVTQRAAAVAGHWPFDELPIGWRQTEISSDASLPATMSAGATTTASDVAQNAISPDLSDVARQMAAEGHEAPLVAPLSAVASGGLTNFPQQPQAPKEPTMPLHSDPQFAEESRSRLSNMPGDMREAARQAIDKGLIDPTNFDLASTALESPLEAVDNPLALEAIVLLTGRPPMLVQNQRVVIDQIALNAMATSLPTLTTAAITAVEGFLPSIGRIEFTNHRMQWGGTGFVIEGGTGDRRRVVTNRHVAKLVAQRVRDGSGVFMRSAAGAPYRARIDMREEYGVANDGSAECQVERVVYLADDTEADCALLEIVITQACNPSPIPLATARAQRDELVAAIGYPAYDDRNQVAPMRQYFGDIFNVKRFAPGLITQSNPGDLLMHDCTTLGGNSGSPIISLAQKAIVGLHFSGRFAEANSAVSVETLKQLQTGKLFAVTEAIPSFDETPADREHTREELKDRGGFDPEFLGGGVLNVPPPELSASQIADLAIPSDATAARPHEIRYTNFGVWYSRGRRQPRFTAVNIDGAQSQKIKRVPPDIWFYDLRIAREDQLGKAFYAGDFDRGHMVRREDPNFGPSAQQANDDTFHYTNCALQHSSLNRGKTLWQGLENYILDSARTEGFKACVFTGPILADDDPPLGMGGIQVPREFWKIVAMPRAGGGGLHVTGYLLSQGDLIRKLLEDRAGGQRGGNEAAAEGFVLGEYRTFQVAVSNLEQATGLRFPGFAAADPLSQCRDEAVSPVTYAPLETFEGIVM